MHVSLSGAGEPVEIGSPVFSTPVVAPTPERVEGTREASVGLNGQTAWRFLMESPSEVPPPTADCQDFDFSALRGRAWKPVVVPGELAMQGFDIENNTEYYYQREISIPTDFEGKRILLRFDGVYSKARCWIDGRFIRSHTGGFTTWDCVIDAFAKPGSTVTLTVGVADIEGDARGTYNPVGEKMGDPSWASYYAHHNIGGILRDVTLLALPMTHVARLYTEVHFDPGFQDATLTVTAQTSGGREAELRLTLVDGSGAAAADGSIRFTGGEARRTALRVRSPRQWDAEHPHLYTLRATLLLDGVPVQSCCVPVGFREIHYGGRDGTQTNRLYVNGREVKLRGTCRHDVSLRYGRSTTREEDWAEIAAYKEANINHVRTSHYPASRHLLDACDALGMYVEQENAACFKGGNGYGVHCPPEDFVGQFTEMLERDRNRPCILLWSLGNESGFESTAAFRTEYEYVKSVDTSRPVMFSYPDTAETSPRPYDVYSLHYERFDGNLGREDIPVLHDEFAHIACYNLEELRRDPNVRNFWGQSIRKAWDSIFETPGALGADLWGGIDDVFFLPEGVRSRWQSHSSGRAAGYGEWGSVLDAYRRLKPEAYLTRKAYTPVRIDEGAARAAGGTLRVPVKNRFDHTNLSELRLSCSVDGGAPWFVSLPAVAPHEAGMIEIPGEWDKASSVELSFYAGERVAESCRLALRERPVLFPDPPSEAPRLHQTADEITVSGEGFEIRIAKRTAQVTRAVLGGRTLLTGGPQLHITGAELGPWESDLAVHAQTEGNHVAVVLQGHYGETLRARFTMRVFADGLIATDYEILHSSLDVKSVSEIGIRFELPPDVEEVSWQRDGLYSLYPESHIGRECGTAARVNPLAARTEYGQAPSYDWKDDMGDDFLYAPGHAGSGVATNDFKAMRENIRSYTVGFSSGDAAIRVESEGDLAARVQVVGGPGGEESAALIVNSQWCYPELGWGNDAGGPVRLSGADDRGGARIRVMRREAPDCV